MQKSNKSLQLQNEILELVGKFHEEFHRKEVFSKGKTAIPYAGRFYDEKEMQNGVKSILEFWLTAGHFSEELERDFKKLFKSDAAYLVNSGSSANLLMVSTLCSRQIQNRLNPGDEVITPAVTFPTTLTPIIQNGLVPVFVDCKPGEYNIDINEIEEAISPRTKCIFIPHTVGIPCDMESVLQIAEKNNLWVLEDGCDALGSKWNGRLVGTFGAMSSISFYPAHHMTMGEGGMVVVNDRKVRKTCLSIRDWGRDCWCNPGINDTCGKRFSWSLGDLPKGYDHKYIYSNLGYNLKVTEMQAAIGCAQFQKLDNFIEIRKTNANFLLNHFKEFSDHIILPEIPEKAEPSWFGMPITVRNHIDRNKLIAFLEERKIATRLVFAGNILKQPGFRHIEHRVHKDLRGTDQIMENTFFIGVYPGLTREMMQYVVESFNDFFSQI